MTKSFQRLHPTHVRALREHIERHGSQRSVERELGLSAGALRNALAGKGVFPSTIARVASLIAAPPQPAPPKPAVGGTESLRDLGAATSLVLDVLSGVKADQRIRVLDAARAAIGG